MRSDGRVLPDLAETLVLHHLGLIRSDELPDLAARWLAADMTDTESTRMLAGHPRQDPWGLDELLSAAADEANVAAETYCTALPRGPRPARSSGSTPSDRAEVESRPRLAGAAPDWFPPPGWQPDPAWPSAPEGWEWWVPDVDAPIGERRTRRTIPQAVKIAVAGPESGPVPVHCLPLPRARRPVQQRR